MEPLGMGLNGGDRKANGTQMSFTRRWRQERDMERVDGGVERGLHIHHRIHRGQGRRIGGGLQEAQRFRAGHRREKEEELFALKEEVAMPGSVLDLRFATAPKGSGQA